MVGTSIRLHGVGIGHGAAVGIVLRMPPPLPDPPDIHSFAEPYAEYARVAKALSVTAGDMLDRAELANGDARDVLRAHALMAQDPALIEDVHERIDAGKTAERAVFEAFQTFQTALQGVGGDMAERVADLRDVSRRAVAQLSGVAMPGVPRSDAPFVLVAQDLAPADTALLELDKVLALVTRDGGPTSHTAILARSKGLIAVVCAPGADALINGQLVIVDADAGQVTADPASEELKQALSRATAAAPARPITPGSLKDATPIPLMANLGSPQDAAAAVALGAEGVGLVRTEFLFLDAGSAPSVETQRAQYIKLLRAFPDKKVIVRVLDAGADKQLAFLGHTHEENPALGRRGIRALREHEQVLRDQLSALAQAQDATQARLGVMAPMVADAEETRYFVELGREFGLGSLGVTIEVPSAALLAEQLVGLVDFVSIGTNDLTQYTMAADRMLGSVSAYQSTWHPAVLRLMKMIGDAGTAARIPVGVCGEAAADPLLAVVFVGLGVNELSMAPAAFSDVRHVLGDVSMKVARRCAARALEATSALQARAMVVQELESGHA
ncbi:phosphoenolpyruvate--protein phosphotransferase [Rathayibacter soli]|uniref:phosphoenolpyruvate--protein phosphotransferase n=1 Tax=Rathayibacter soli TaxID=3144168 RepID=UPI0027E520F5|nr:phosphoenolpyruvate--protein phosphotransferase [Glaciibacter superstes]